MIGRVDMGDVNHEEFDSRYDHFHDRLLMKKKLVDFVVGWIQREVMNKCIVNSIDFIERNFCWYCGNDKSCLF